MPAKVCKRLVIDASVARAAGRENATNPTAKNCRDFLKVVRELRHIIVMTPDIKEEWNKHQSLFARRWRSSMVAQKQLEYRTDILTNNELWDVCDRLAETDNQRQEMFKDLRLLEAALVTDKIVISLDDNTARRFFSRAARELEAIADIVWVNPNNVEEEQPIAWLENGAEPEKERYLGFWQPEG
ncbi:MAG: hypothetical protein F6J93_19035 [Oscillatoria sp. SIO1A7]|nr:hypothetical protein [Oscillatoria sp. SIO1A7]